MGRDKALLPWPPNHRPGGTFLSAAIRLLTAHGVFVDQALAVVGMTRLEALCQVLGNQAAPDFPAKEFLTGVAAPQRAVAVEGGQLGIEPQDRVEKVMVLLPLTSPGDDCVGIRGRDLLHGWRSPFGNF